MPSVAGVNQKKPLPIVYVIDTSGSMRGDKIAAVNIAMRESIKVLKEVADKNMNAEVKIAILVFDENPKWIQEQPVSLEDFEWKEIKEKSGARTNFGKALNELAAKRSLNELLASSIGSKEPNIIIMSDGAPTDTGWEEALNTLKSNSSWFGIANKIAVAIGDEADKNILKKIVGDNGIVIEADDNETLKKSISVVTVTIGKEVGKSVHPNAPNQIMNKIENGLTGEAKVERGNDLKDGKQEWIDIDMSDEGEVTDINDEIDGSKWIDIDSDLN